MGIQNTNKAWKPNPLRVVLAAVDGIFWGAVVGAFMASCLAAALFALAFSGYPGEWVPYVAVPGAVVGAVYLCVRRVREVLWPAPPSRFEQMLKAGRK